MQFIKGFSKGLTVGAIIAIMLYAYQWWSCDASGGILYKPAQSILMECTNDDLRIEWK